MTARGIAPSYVVVALVVDAPISLSVMYKTSQASHLPIFAASTCSNVHELGRNIHHSYPIIFHRQWLDSLISQTQMGYRGVHIPILAYDWLYEVR